MYLYVFGLLNHSNTLPFFFPAQIISVLATESHFKLASVSLWQVIIIMKYLKNLSFSYSKNCGRLIWFLFAPILESARASKGPGSLNRRIMWIQSAKYARCYWAFPVSRSSQWWSNMYIYTHRREILITLEIMKIWLQYKRLNMITTPKLLCYSIF